MSKYPEVGVTPPGTRLLCNDSCVTSSGGGFSKGDIVYLREWSLDCAHVSLRPDGPQYGGWYHYRFLIVEDDWDVS